jgi:hypothetical protein
VEPPLITIGDDLNTVAQFLASGRASYSAAEVVESLLSLAADAEPAQAVESSLAQEQVMATA